jgi:hypothetical protein
VGLAETLDQGRKFVKETESRIQSAKHKQQNTNSKTQTAKSSHSVTNTTTTRIMKGSIFAGLIAAATLTVSQAQDTQLQVANVSHYDNQTLPGTDSEVSDDLDASGTAPLKRCQCAAVCSLDGLGDISTFYSSDIAVQESTKLLPIGAKKNTAQVVSLYSNQQDGISILARVQTSGDGKWATTSVAFGGGSNYTAKGCKQAGQVLANYTQPVALGKINAQVSCVAPELMPGGSFHLKTNIIRTTRKSTEGNFSKKDQGATGICKFVPSNPDAKKDNTNCICAGACTAGNGQAKSYYNTIVPLSSTRQSLRKPAKQVTLLSDDEMSVTLTLDASGSVMKVTAVSKAAPTRKSKTTVFDVKQCGSKANAFKWSNNSTRATTSVTMTCDSMPGKDAMFQVGVVRKDVATDEITRFAQIEKSLGAQGLCSARGPQDSE